MATKRDLAEQAVRDRFGLTDAELVLMHQVGVWFRFTAVGAQISGWIVTDERGIVLGMLQDPEFLRPTDEVTGK